MPKVLAKVSFNTTDCLRLCHRPSHRLRFRPAQLKQFFALKKIVHHVIILFNEIEVLISHPVLEEFFVMLWRHGDVLIATIEAVPERARPVSTSILAHGEVTGHSHRIADPTSAKLWQDGETLFMQVVASTARLVHEEHAPIELPRGLYRVWGQREYTPRAIVRVSD
jgi:hypothetical protein